MEEQVEMVRLLALELEKELNRLHRMHGIGFKFELESYDRDDNYVLGIENLAEEIRSKKFFGGEVAELGEVWASKLDAIADRISRERFEERIYSQYFISHVGPNLRLDGRPMLNKAQLCAKDEKGAYTDKDVSAMWFGWNKLLEAMNGN